MENITLIAIDIAKETFHVRGINHRGKALFNKKISRHRLIPTIEEIAPKNGCSIAMEACATSHYWGREFQKMGHTPKLIAAQFVKPFVKSNKNDQADAEAIAEAASRESMRFVSVKTEEQQSIQIVHRVRTRLVSNRTQILNELRSILAEFGFYIPRGKKTLTTIARDILGKNSIHLTMYIRNIINHLLEEVSLLDDKIKEYEVTLKEISKSNAVCQNLSTIPGVGLITSTALFASYGQSTQFKNGRAMAASLGLVPRQNSSGGKSQLGRISKRGDPYIRKLMVHGARSVLKVSHRKNDHYNLWATSLRDSKGYNKAAVALANRNARIAWVILSKQKETFNPKHIGVKTIMH